jgi:adenine phosphoribosyltransferase
MATLDSLKRALKEKTAASASSQHPLSETQYSTGFGLLTQGPGWITYEDFVVPQLSQLLCPLFDSRLQISVLEIGPGPKTVLGYLPDSLRRKINRYTALEPNGLFATALEKRLCPSPAETESPLPCLESPPCIHRVPFVVEDKMRGGGEKFDVILFCHSMYGMKPKRRFIEQALGMLVEQPQDALVVVFHREGLYLDGLVPHRTASFPNRVIHVADDDETLDCFAVFNLGVDTRDNVVRAAWRNVCRTLGRREAAYPNHLLFAAPDVMAAFTRHATALPKLTVEVPFVHGVTTVKNREARLRRPAVVMKPTEIGHVQRCVQWALEHNTGLTVIGGGHSGHCLWPNVVAVDMGAFDEVHILPAGEHSDFGTLVHAEVGCKTGDIVRKTMAAGLTVPLGARPSVGAGLWLQGGIGHLARQYGLASDAVVGAVIVSVNSGQVLSLGYVSSQHRPLGAVCLDDAELLWGLKGAGANFGIVVSVTFKAYPAPTYSVRNWVLPLSDDLEARQKLDTFDKLVARGLPRNCSADAYLYSNNGQLSLGVTMFETSIATPGLETPTPIPVSTFLGPPSSSEIVDSIGVFESEMYMSGLHGGHGGGKTSSFKRSLLLKDIGQANVAGLLVAAIETRPTPFCYLHLLQGGGAVIDAAPDSTAFGCRDWDFACVVTGVWPRDQDQTETALATVRWVYEVAGKLLPVSSGAYGADLGPDPRDAVLAATAFGPNLRRLGHLKQIMDPCRVLSYACPLPEVPLEPKLIVLVTGEHGAGKDYCADVWVSFFSNHKFRAQAVSISEVTKREYASATGADLNRLFWDRTYKEQHRPALTSYFQDQVRQRPQLPEEHFLSAVHGATGFDVLFITGMRDEAPVASLSHLVPRSRLLEVCVKINEKTRYARKVHVEVEDVVRNKSNENGKANSVALDNRPNLIFSNDMAGNEAGTMFADQQLLPFLHGDLQRLATMVRSVSDFPRPGISFRHVLDISQRPGGLALCTSLLASHFAGNWNKLDAVVCCEAGGFVFASALASRVNMPLGLIREAGKLPPPTVSVSKSPSHISSAASNESKERIEMEQDVVRKGASVLVVDDVLATGRTLCAVLRLLGEAGIGAQTVSIMVVAEFPIHRGRDLLRQHGFGGVNIQSLLVFDGI